MALRSGMILLSFYALAFSAIFESGRTCRAEGDASARTTLYANDPLHLWNRMHEALMMRQGPDKRFYGEDRLEPLLWDESDHLLKSKGAERCVAVLEEFLRDHGEAQIHAPLKRALMQRDLWMIASWLHGTASAENTEARRKLGTLLARVIERLALTDEQIGKLPDNYAEAVKAKSFAEKFAPDRPEQSYLPPDLFKADGPWVGIAAEKGPTAPMHLRDESNAFTNSTFLIFLKLPGGREATLRFLKDLAALNEPLFVENGIRDRPDRFPTYRSRRFPRGLRARKSHWYGGPCSSTQTFA